MPRIDLGDVYLIETPPNGNHFYVSIMLLENGSHLFVNYSTVQDITPDEDLQYILRPSPTLPFVSRDSFFVYRKTRELSGADLERLNCIKKGAFPLSVVKEIQRAGLAHKGLKNKYKTQLRTLGL
jgi:hypothetical protein